MFGDPPRKLDCQEIIFESEPSEGNCLSEKDKRQYCERLVEKVLQEYPHLSASEVMVRLGYVCMASAKDSRTSLGRSISQKARDRHQQESTESESDRRKAVYAETLCRQVLLENPHFHPSQVRGVVRNLLNMVPEVDDATEDGDFRTVTNSSYPPSMTVELSRQDCSEHNKAFDLIMEEVLGTRNICGDINSSLNRQANEVHEGHCDDARYRRTRSEKSYQHKSKERDALTEAEISHKLNCYLTDICKNLEKENTKYSTSYGRKMQKEKCKPSRNTFADSNSCKLGRKKWMGGDSEYSSCLPNRTNYWEKSCGSASACNNYMSKPSNDEARLWKSSHLVKDTSNPSEMTFSNYNPCIVGCEDWEGDGSRLRSTLPTSRGYWPKGSGVIPPGNCYAGAEFKNKTNVDKYSNPCYDNTDAELAFWEVNPCNVMVDEWCTKGGISAGDFRLSVPPRMPATERFDPMYMSPRFKTPNVASYGKWKDPLSECCNNDRDVFAGFGSRNPCSIWSQPCGSRNDSRYRPRAPNYLQRKCTTLPNNTYPSQRHYASSRLKYPGVNCYR